MRRFNPYEFHTPPGWNPIASAPRDGTIIEIQNNYGIAPHFGLFKWHKTEWGDEGWRHANDPEIGGCSSTDALHLSWRPYEGSLDDYRDPTGGAQDTRAYWIRASGLNPADYPGSEMNWEEEARLDRRREHPAEQKKKGLFRKIADALGVA